uniref:LIM zinc-binding domain-containing protein n=1 Tax=Monopterus albus TaxID=43700 RepID=A0A3Q3K7R0_MONAL
MLSRSPSLSLTVQTLPLLLSPAIQQSISSFPPLGDKCHSCERRVYMMERVCAEGLYFHRECFRCSTCSSSLRQGMHAFDSGQGLYHLMKNHEGKKTNNYMSNS